MAGGQSFVGKPLRHAANHAAMPVFTCMPLENLQADAVPTGYTKRTADMSESNQESHP